MSKPAQKTVSPNTPSTAFTSISSLYITLGIVGVGVFVMSNALAKTIESDPELYKDMIPQLVEFLSKQAHGEALTLSPGYEPFKVAVNTPSNGNNPNANKNNEGNDTQNEMGESEGGFSQPFVLYGNGDEANVYKFMIQSEYNNSNVSNFNSDFAGGGYLGAGDGPTTLLNPDPEIIPEPEIPVTPPIELEPEGDNTNFDNKSFGDFNDEPQGDEVGFNENLFNNLDGEPQGDETKFNEDSFDTFDEPQGDSTSFASLDFSSFNSEPQGDDTTFENSYFDNFDNNVDNSTPEDENLDDLELSHDEGGSSESSEEPNVETDQA